MNIQRFLLLSTLVILTACNVGNSTGYVPTATEIREIQIGQETQASIVEKFGPPAIIGENQDSWYYVSSQRKYPGPLPTVESSRRILAIRFDGDVVAGVSEFDQEQGQDVPISRYTTETGGRELTLLQQLLGSFGNFSAENFLQNAAN